MEVLGYPLLGMTLDTIKRQKKQHDRHLKEACGAVAMTRSRAYRAGTEEKKTRTLSMASWSCALAYRHAMCSSATSTSNGYLGRRKIRGEMSVGYCWLRALRLEQAAQVHQP